LFLFFFDRREELISGRCSCVNFWPESLPVRTSKGWSQPVRAAILQGGDVLSHNRRLLCLWFFFFVVFSGDLGHCQGRDLRNLFDNGSTEVPPPISKNFKEFDDWKRGAPREFLQRDLEFRRSAAREFLRNFQEKQKDWPRTDSQIRKFLPFDCWDDNCEEG